MEDGQQRTRAFLERAFATHVLRTGTHVVDGGGAFVDMLMESAEMRAKLLRVADTLVPAHAELSDEQVRRAYMVYVDARPLLPSEISRNIRKVVGARDAVTLQNTTLRTTTYVPLNYASAGHAFHDVRAALVRISRIPAGKRTKGDVPASLWDAVVATGDPLFSTSRRTFGYVLWNARLGGTARVMRYVPPDAPPEEQSESDAGTPLLHDAVVSTARLCARPTCARLWGGTYAITGIDAAIDATGEPAPVVPDPNGNSPPCGHDSAIMAAAAALRDQVRCAAGGEVPLAHILYGNYSGADEAPVFYAPCAPSPVTSTAQLGVAARAWGNAPHHAHRLSWWVRTLVHFVDNPAEAVALDTLPGSAGAPTATLAAYVATGAYEVRTWMRRGCPTVTDMENARTCTPDLGAYVRSCVWSRLLEYVATVYTMPVMSLALVLARNMPLNPTIGNVCGTFGGAVQRADKATEIPRAYIDADQLEVMSDFSAQSTQRSIMTPLGLASPRQQDGSTDDTDDNSDDDAYTTGPVRRAGRIVGATYPCELLGHLYPYALHLAPTSGSCKEKTLHSCTSGARIAWTKEEGVMYTVHTAPPDAYSTSLADSMAPSRASVVTTVSRLARGGFIAHGAHYDAHTRELVLHRDDDRLIREHVLPPVGDVAPIVSVARALDADVRAVLLAAVRFVRLFTHTQTTTRRGDGASMRVWKGIATQRTLSLRKLEASSFRVTTPDCASVFMLEMNTILHIPWVSREADVVYLTPPAGRVAAWTWTVLHAVSSLRGYSAALIEALVPPPNVLVDMREPSMTRVALLLEFFLPRVMSRTLLTLCVGVLDTVLTAYAGAMERTENEGGERAARFASAYTRLVGARNVLGYQQLMGRESAMNEKDETTAFAYSKRRWKRRKRGGMHSPGDALEDIVGVCSQFANTRALYNRARRLTGGADAGSADAAAYFIPPFYDPTVDDTPTHILLVESATAALELADLIKSDTGGAMYIRKLRDYAFAMVFGMRTLTGEYIKPHEGASVWRPPVLERVHITDDDWAVVGCFVRAGADTDSFTWSGNTCTRTHDDGDGGGAGGRPADALWTALHAVATTRANTRAGVDTLRIPACADAVGVFDGRQETELLANAPTKRRSRVSRLVDASRRRHYTRSDCVIRQAGTHERVVAMPNMASRVTRRAYVDRAVMDADVSNTGRFTAYTGRSTHNRALFEFFRMLPDNSMPFHGSDPEAVGLLLNASMRSHIRSVDVRMQALDDTWVRYATGALCGGADVHGAPGKRARPLRYDCNGSSDEGREGDVRRRARNDPHVFIRPHALTRPVGFEYATVVFPDAPRDVIASSGASV